MGRRSFGMVDLVVENVLPLAGGLRGRMIGNPGTEATELLATHAVQTQTLHGTGICIH